MNNSFKIFCGNSNPVLAQEICDYLGVPLGDATVNSFPDGESFVRIEENIRGMDVFIIQPAYRQTIKKELRSNCSNRFITTYSDIFSS